MEIKVDINKKEKSITLSIPAKNAGKFRFKSRSVSSPFGRPSNTFKKGLYLEWNIGYDMLVKDFKDKDKKKTTILNGDAFEFRGSDKNKSRKYPYELSELFCLACKNRLFSKKKIELLIKDIEKYEDFLDSEEKIITEKAKDNISLNTLKFKKTFTKLPTYFLVNGKAKEQIDVIVKQQQRAYGVEFPMVYYCIPFEAFQGHDQYNKMTLKDIKELKYIINKKNVTNLLLLMKVFGMTSTNHKKDILNILNIVKNNL